MYFLIIALFLLNYEQLFKNNIYFNRKKDKNKEICCHKQKNIIKYSMRQPLQMLVPDGKMRKTQAANIEGILRIIQSISSPKAEPFKILWMAKVGAEHLDEIADPEKAKQHAVATYKAKGYSDKWITQRLRSIEIRKELTDE